MCGRARGLLEEALRHFELSLEISLVTRGRVLKGLTGKFVRHQRGVVSAKTE